MPNTFSSTFWDQGSRTPSDRALPHGTWASVLRAYGCERLGTVASGLRPNVVGAAPETREAMSSLFDDSFLAGLQSTEDGTRRRPQDHAPEAVPEGESSRASTSPRRPGDGYYLGTATRARSSTPRRCSTG
ncbi:hypothetical protein SMICM304S_08204 [Streptomyces microflavus]